MKRTGNFKAVYKDILESSNPEELSNITFKTWERKIVSLDIPVALKEKFSWQHISNRLKSMKVETSKWELPPKEIEIFANELLQNHYVEKIGWSWAEFEAFWNKIKSWVEAEIGQSLLEGKWSVGDYFVNGHDEVTDLIYNMGPGQIDIVSLASSQGKVTNTPVYRDIPTVPYYTPNYVLIDTKTILKRLQKDFKEKYGEVVEGKFSVEDLLDLVETVMKEEDKTELAIALNV